MSADRHQRMADLFERACALPQAQRPAFLQDLCRDDPALRADVEALLAHDVRPIALIDSAASGAAIGQLARDLAAAGELPARAPGTDLPPRIGAYRIIRLIGEGGMGVVYEAEQDDPHRRVALKVIRPGLVTRSLLSRFRHEAQVLGHLKHPGIAQIYEAGTTDRGEGGQPYFAMELVEGPSLIDYANAKRLGARARLELMAMVCDAVHHAHQKGVVHRDLKPANILVEEPGQPKILDFGVARATDADIQAVTLQTDVGQIIGTLPYMSPEQAAGDPADLDVRSDVYALGVVTYELLTGRLPYAVQGKMLHEALRVIRDEAPSRLSSIDRNLRGDVDTIVAKALEKPKDRRYQSAAEFAADIRRYLNDESIVARPTSALYQWRRFARRNKRLVAAIGAAFAVLLIATVVSLRLLALAHVAREDARLEAEIAQITAAASLIDGGDPVAAREALQSIPQDRRNWEWRYHAARLDRSILRINVGEPLSTAQFTPDGTEIITATKSGTITRWTIDGDGPRSSLKLDSETLGPIAFDRDGHLAAAATGTGNTLVVWSTADGHRVAEYDIPISEGDDPNLHWSRVALPAGNRPSPVSAPPIPADSGDSGEPGSFLPSSAPLRAPLPPIPFITASRLAYLLTASNPSTPVPLESPTGVQSPAISLDARRIALSGHDGLAIFDATTAAQLLTIRRPNIGLLDPIAFIGNTHQVIYGARKRLYLFDPDHPDLHASLRGHSGTITAIASDPSGRWLASGAIDTTLRIWDRTTQSLVATLSGHDAAISAIAFHPDGNRVLSASLDGTLRLWTREPDDSSTVLRGHRSYVYPVAFTSDGRRIISGSWDGDLRIWDAASGECIATIPTGDAWIASLAISPDDSCIVTGHPQDRIQCYDAATGTLIVAQQLPSRDVVNALAFDPETSSLLLRSVSSLRIIAAPADVSRTERTADWITRAHVESLMQEGWAEEQKSAVACSPTSPQVAVACQDGSVRILDLRTGADLHRLTPPTPKTLCFSLAFTPDGTTLATGHRDGTIHLWTTATGNHIRTLTGHQSDVFALAFTPDATRLASGSDDTSIRIWDPTTGKQLALLPGHDDYVFSLAFSPDGSTLASGSGDTTLRVWDTRPVHARFGAKTTEVGQALRLMPDRAVR